MEAFVVRVLNSLKSYGNFGNLQLQNRLHFIKVKAVVIKHLQSSRTQDANNTLTQIVALSSIRLNFGEAQEPISTESERERCR